MSLVWEFAWAGCFVCLPLPWLVRRWWPPVGSALALRVPRLPAEALAPGSAAFSIASWRLPWMAVLVWFLLVTAAARPRVLDEQAAPPPHGRSFMLAVDVSASMATQDLLRAGKPVDRLAAARHLVDGFLANRRGDQVGLVVFGARAYLHTPLTTDIQALREGLAGLEAGLVGQQTALGDAIALAAGHLEKQPVDGRILVLLTDGANTSGKLDPAQAAWLARRASLRIHAVGIGAAATPRQEGFDEATLRRLAEQTGGSYSRATDAEELQAFFARIERQEWGALAEHGGANGARPMRELYAWPLAVALVLLAWLSGRHGREETV